MWTSDIGYYAKFKYVEVARYLNIEGTELVARYMQDKEKKIPLLVEWNEVPSYVNRSNNVGMYTSIFRYSNSQFSDNATRLGSLYFDIDSDDHTVATSDTKRVVEYLAGFISPDAIRVYFTGKKGFHVECEAVALGITPTSELPGIFRFIASDIGEVLQVSTFDSAVYDARRMWRVPNSKHQSTGLYKIPISMEELETLSYAEISELAKAPRQLEVPIQQFDLVANEWYREYTYRYEQSKIQRNVTAQSVIERFNQHGSVSLDNYERQFDPIKLFENCPVILELWNKAETQHNLEHSERLFLCSILSYTDEAVEYLHAILSNCSDYRFEKSQAHIDDWIRRREMSIGGRAFSCEKAKDLGIVCNGCSKLESKKKWVEIGGKYYTSDEEAKPSPVRFAYERKKT